MKNMRDEFGIDKRLMKTLCEEPIVAQQDVEEEQAGDV